MKTVMMLIMAMVLAGTALGAEKPWYTGDQRCPPPRDDGTYCDPYNALEHPNDYPTFVGADKPGWSCSYQREDGVIVQFGDSRTPQEQWLAVWGGNGSTDN